MTIWVNVYFSPYDADRFYFSQSYRTRRDAYARRKHYRELNDRYIETISITLNFKQNEKSNRKN